MAVTPAGGKDRGAAAAHVVIKIGGELIDGPEVRALGGEIRSLRDAGMRAAVVHGGGPQATELQKRLGIEPKIVGGRRVTDSPTLDVMKMVVAGRLNVDLCAALGASGVPAVGLHGASAGAIRASRRPPRMVPGGGDQPVDFGLVGDVVGFNLELLNSLEAGGYVPVLACLGVDESGQCLNINADTVAGELAVALRARSLVLVTGVPGVLKDAKDPASRIPKLGVREARSLISNGTARGGMIVKLDEALAALDDGVPSVVVVGALRPGDLVRALSEPGSVGTTISPA